jgi:ankyrin repeat protein
MKWMICVFFLLSGAVGGANAPKSILFLAGKPSHAEGEHEFYRSGEVLVDALNGSGLPLVARLKKDVWPDEEELADLDALVLYSDGDGDHPVRGHEASLKALSDRGVGIAILHYALDGEPGALNEAIQYCVGGFYDEAVSQNPLWTVKEMRLAEHVITAGVAPFELKDEWYYALRFNAVTPLLMAIPPEEQEEQVLAWAFEAEGRRGFGFTGGHYHSNWAHADFRKLVLNGIVWSAGVELPERGVHSSAPLVARHKTILHAIAKGDAEDVKIHLALGEDIHQKNAKGWTLLHFAAVRGQTEAARVLIEAGVELDGRTGTEKTALHFVADRGFLAFAHLLVEAGADLMARDDERWSPLHYAAEKDRVDVAAYLLSKGAPVNMTSRRGGTPLHEAAASASPAMIQLLLDHGADRGIKATNGKTALDYAIELNNSAAVPLLR